VRWGEEEEEEEQEQDLYYSRLETRERVQRRREALFAIVNA